MKNAVYLFLALCITITAQAGSLRLKNNSGDKLRVIIEGSDGSHLGEVIIDAQKSMTWTDTYGYKTTNRGAGKPLQQADASKTPYTVSWFCMAGDPYSVCTDVAVGSLIMADSCDGLRACNPHSKSGYPPQKEEESQ